MYPIVRFAKEMWLARRAPALAFGQTHVSHHLCWPWDLDLWIELNNGRTLTLYDLGRVPAARRIGVDRALAAQGWSMVVAGASVRYRRRIRAFDRLEMRTRALGWDDRFLYTEQSIWVRGHCANHILVRSAVTGGDGIVAPERLAEVLGLGKSPDLPDWVRAWIGADATRPWPPQ